MCKWAALPVIGMAVLSVPFGGPDLASVGAALLFVVVFAATLWLIAMAFDFIGLLFRFVWSLGRWR
jgi:hypothetical protein